TPEQVTQGTRQIVAQVFEKSRFPPAIGNRHLVSVGDDLVCDQICSEPSRKLSIRFEPMQSRLRVIIMDKKSESPFVRANVDEFIAVRCQLPHQSEGRALRKHALKLAECISGLVECNATAQIRIES